MNKNWDGRNVSNWERDSYRFWIVIDLYYLCSVVREGTASFDLVFSAVSSKTQILTENSVRQCQGRISDTDSLKTKAKKQKQNKWELRLLLVTLYALYVWVLHQTTRLHPRAGRLFRRITTVGINLRMLNLKQVCVRSSARTRTYALTVRILWTAEHHWRDATPTRWISIPAWYPNCGASARSTHHGTTSQG